MKNFKQLVSEIYAPNTPDAEKFINLHLVKNHDYPVENKDGLPFRDDSIKAPGPQHNKGPYHSEKESEKAYNQANSGTGENLHKEEFIEENLSYEIFGKDLSDKLDNMHDATVKSYAAHGKDKLIEYHSKLSQKIKSLPPSAKTYNSKKDSYSVANENLVNHEYFVRKALKDHFNHEVKRPKHNLLKGPGSLLDRPEEK